MGKELPHGDKPVFGVASGENGYTIIVGVTKAAWKFCEHGKTLTIDLLQAGVPVQFILFGCENQQEAKNLIMKHNERHHRSSIDMTEKPDFGIKEGSQSMNDLKSKILR